MSFRKPKGPSAEHWPAVPRERTSPAAVVLNMLPALPIMAWVVLFLVVPMAIMVVFSF